MPTAKGKKAAPKKTAPPKAKMAPKKMAPKRRSNRPYLIAGACLIGIILVIGLLYGYYHYIHFKALAEFDGEKVTRDEFIRGLRLEAAKYDPLIWKDEKQALRLKQKILDDIIRERILLRETGRQGISVSDDELKTELNSYKSGYTDASFLKMLKLKGISYKDWAEKKRRKYLTQKLIENAVLDKIENSPDEISKYYKEHAKEFSHPEQVRARHIMTNNWEEAQKIAEELKAGGNFAAIAKEKSISPERWKGGDLGYFAKGTHPKVFDLVCFNTPVGEASQVVKSDYGYHIFKVIDKRGPVKESPADAKKYIDTQLKKQKSKEAFEIWFKPIYDSSEIKINHDLLKRIEVNINDRNTE